MTETEKPTVEGDPGRGRRLGVDVGSVRIGVAMSDPDCILASPVETVQAAVDGSDVARVVEIVRENFVVEVIVGLPVARVPVRGRRAPDRGSRHPRARARR